MHAKIIKIFQLILILVFHQTAGNNSTQYNLAFNNVKLLELVEPEAKFYGSIIQFVNASVNLSCQKSLVSYVEDYEEGGTEQRLITIANNPLAMFKMLWRLFKKFPEIMSLCDTEEISRIVEEFENSCKILKISLSTEFDLPCAVEGILRIQFAYKLDTYSVSQGIIGNLNTGVKLSYENCLEISRITTTGQKPEQIPFAKEWLEIGRDLATKKFGSEFTRELTPEFKKLLLQHDEMWGNNDRSEKRPAGNKTTEKQLHLGRNPEYGPSGSVLQDKAYYSCAGGHLQTGQTSLNCYSSRNLHAYFLINPLRIEVLNEDPMLLQIYDIIGDSVIHNILEDTNPAFRESYQIDNEKAAYKNPCRDGEIVDVSRKGYLQPLYKTLEFISGLALLGEASRYFRAKRYSSLGPSHPLHIDVKAFQDQEEFTKPQWLATFLLYLNNVEMGGRTAFPTMGLAAKPIKNSVIFWYHFHPNLTDIDERTVHVGCPVAYGKKETSNKFIFAWPNMFNHKCSLDKFATNNAQIFMHRKIKA